MSVNKVILVGNLGKDPDLRYTPSGAAVAGFSLATSEKFKDRDGQMQERTEWHNIVAWRQLAETCAKYLTKGKMVYLEGKIQTRNYADRDGNKRYITEIVADQMRFLDKANGQVRDQGRQSGNQSRNQPSQQSRPQSGNQPGPNAGAGASSGGGQFDEYPPFNPDDEIPF